MTKLLKSERAPGEVSDAPPITLSSLTAEATPLLANSEQETNLSLVCPLCGGYKWAEGTICFGCYQKSRVHKVEQTCAFCKAFFLRPQHSYNKWLKRGQTEAYCSMACSRSHHAVKNAGKCQRCGQPKLRPNRYCSDACKEEARLQRAQARVVLSAECKWCGVTFRPVSLRVQYCGRPCAESAHSVRMRGSGNSHFKDGTSYAKWFADMRPLILYRDKQMCVTCQKPEAKSDMAWSGQIISRTNMHIHHINRDPKDNTANNLVTLCKNCHRRHHGSVVTPWPWLDAYAAGASLSMTSRWKGAVTFLQKAHSPITA